MREDPGPEPAHAGRTWGTVHHVLEDIGPRPEELVLGSAIPTSWAMREEKVGTDACAALICANGHGPVPGQGVAAIATHFVRRIPGGIGCAPALDRLRPGGRQAGQAGARRRVRPGGGVPMGLFAHNLKEFGHLAAILPQVYAENKDNW